MDPLSLTASIAAIIEISKTIASICVAYISNYQDAPKDLRNIIIEVGAIKCVVEVIRLVASQSSGSNSTVLKHLTSPDGPLKACEKALSDLRSLFPQVERTVNGEKRKCLASLERLMWPMQAAKARKLLDDIRNFKATISLILTSDTLVDIKTIGSNVEQIRNTLTDQDHKDILKWLVTTDPSPNHNAACGLHEAYTGKWLLRSPDYEQWLTGATRFFWIHGIPGAGKTVLLSFIAQNMQKYCREEAPQGAGWSYYYCYFRRSQDETPHLLRWVMSQLCRQSKYIPNQVSEMFQDGTEPSTASLTSAFSATCRAFCCVYLLVDALDESQDRSKLLSTLTCLISPEFPNVKILATSRREPDIERMLRRVSQEISLSNPLVDEDIRQYIRAVLSSDHRFTEWPRSLAMDVEIALVEGAKGMFRWVVCQLDILRRLSSESAIRTALKDLPETLDDTYERILGSIPAHNRIYAHRTLQWLSEEVSEDHLTLGALAVAVVMPYHQGKFIPGDQLLHPKELEEICSCLIEVGSSVRLAHYTVKEFLYSDRIKNGPASMFSSSSRQANILFAKTFITYLLNADYSIVNDSMSLIQSPPSGDWDVPSLQAFHQFAIGSWNLCARRVEQQGSDDEINGLVLQLLDPYRPDFQDFRKDCALYHGKDYFPDWRISEEGYSSAVLSYTCSVDLIEAAKTWLERYDTLSVTDQEVKEGLTFYCMYLDTEKYFVGSPFDIAVKLGRENFVTIFLRQGRVNPKSRNYLCYSVLGSIVASEMSVDFVCECLWILMKNGADPNKSDVSITPLQLAVLEVCNGRSNIKVVKLLLDFGADVNAVGDDDAVIKYLERIYGNDVGYYGKIHRRGLNLACYDTPLRIVQGPNRLYPGGDKITTLIELLKRHGALSLHLFPVPDLPGYVGEDFESLKRHREESFTGVVMEDTTSSSTLVESLVVLPCPSMFTTMDLDSEDRSRGYTLGGERPPETSLTHRRKRGKTTSTTYLPTTQVVRPFHYRI